MPSLAESQGYSRPEVCRMLGITERRLREWQRQGLVRETALFTFSDLIALRTVQKLRENRIPARQIVRALTSLKTKLSHIEHPLSELKVFSDGRKIAVRVAGQKMEALTGQMLFDFDTAELDNVRSFQAPARKSRPEVDESQAELWFHRGLELEESGAPVGQAVEAYEKAIALNPSAAGALVNLGTIYYHLRQYPKARDAYERAVAVDSKYPLAHFNLGNLCDETGHLEEARRHYTTALKLNPSYADAHYNMALLCERNGDYLSAARHWKAYLKVDPASSWASVARRQLEKIRQATVVTGRR